MTGSDQQTQFVIDSGFLVAALELLNNSRKIIRKEICWAISNITAGTSQQIQVLQDLIL